MFAIIAKVLLSLGTTFFKIAEKKVDAETERLKINADVLKKEIEHKTEVVHASREYATTAMGFKVFWIPWLIATVPLSIWFAWGILDSAIYEGSVLPDVAELPPQLYEYAKDVWSSIFISGAGMAGLQTIANVLSRR